jgi:hypothetical protein
MTLGNAGTMPMAALEDISTFSPHESRSLAQDRYERYELC